MKYTFAAAAVILATCNAVATAGTLWQGDLFVTTATSACYTKGTNAGDFSQAVYSPLGKVGNGGAQDQLAIFFPRGSALLVVPASGGTLNKATTVNVTTINSNATGGTATWSVTGLTVSQPVQAGVPVKISFGVSNFLSVSGCNVSLSGTLAPKPANLPN